MPYRVKQYFSECLSSSLPRGQRSISSLQEISQYKSTAKTVTIPRISKMPIPQNEPAGWMENDRWQSSSPLWLPKKAMTPIRFLICYVTNMDYHAQTIACRLALNLEFQMSHTFLATALACNHRITIKWYLLRFVLAQEQHSKLEKRANWIESNW